MTFLDKLELLMKNKNIKNLHDLSIKSKIPYSTLRGFYSKGTENIKLPTLKTLAKFFNCSIDYLADDEIIEIKPYGDSNIEEKELELFQKILKENGLLDKNEILTDEKLEHTLEVLKANKKFILLSDESDNLNKWCFINIMLF